MEEERLSGALQENILTLLCFDNANCKIARAALTPQLFESSVFREIAGHAIDFIDQFGEAIGEHLPDHLEHILKGEDQRKADTYQKLVINLFAAKDGLNSAYVLSQLNKFVRQQGLKDSLRRALEAMEDGKIDLVETEMAKGLNKQIIVFSPGLNLSDSDAMAKVFEGGLDDPGFELGMPGFDKNGIIPRRKALTMLIAARGRGKSWFITHCAKMALLQRWKVLVITLEMSERMYMGRLLQSFFSLSRREGETQIAQLVRDRKGALEDVLYEKVLRDSLASAGMNDKMVARIKREFRKRPPLHVKEFPTKGADMNSIRAYLDGMERFQNFVPDVILIDYPDLIKHDAKNKRIELGQIIEEIRGVGVERNAAMIVVSQGNRESETATTVTGDMVAEDISKLATVDVCFTYSQTEMERKMGLARLMAEKARNEADSYSLLITQAYGIGQFCLDSTILHGDYWDMVRGKRDEEGGRKRHRPGDREEKEEKEKAPARRPRVGK